MTQKLPLFTESSEAVGYLEENLDILKLSEQLYLADLILSLVETEFQALLDYEVDNVLTEDDADRLKALFSLISSVLQDSQ